MGRSSSEKSCLPVQSSTGLTTAGGGRSISCLLSAAGRAGQAGCQGKAARKHAGDSSRKGKYCHSHCGFTRTRHVPRQLADLGPREEAVLAGQQVGRRQEVLHTHTQQRQWRQRSSSCPHTRNTHSCRATGTVTLHGHPPKAQRCCSHSKQNAAAHNGSGGSSASDSAPAWPR